MSSHPHPPTPCASPRPGRDARGRFVKRDPAPGAAAPAPGTPSPEPVADPATAPEPASVVACSGPAAHALIRASTPAPPTPEPVAWRAELSALLATELDRLRQDLACTAEDARRDLELELGGAREALARREQDVQALEARCKSLEEARAACDGETEALRGELAAAREALSRREQEVASLEARCARLEEKRGALAERCAELDEAHAAHEEETGVLRAELGQARARIEALEEAPGDVEPVAPAALDPAADRAEDLGEGELARVRERLALAERTLAVRDEEITLLRGSALRAQKALAEREAELQTLRRSLAEARRDLARRATESHRVRASLAAVARIVRSADAPADDVAPEPARAAPGAEAAQAEAVSRAPASLPVEASAGGPGPSAARDAAVGDASGPTASAVAIPEDAPAGASPPPVPAEPLHTEAGATGRADEHARVAAADPEHEDTGADDPPAPLFLPRPLPGRARDDGRGLRDKLPDPDWHRAAQPPAAAERRRGRRGLLGWITRGSRPREPEARGGWTRPGPTRTAHDGAAVPPPAPGRAPGPPATAIHRYWEQTQAAEKLAPSGARDVPTFFADAVERAARSAHGRPVRILALASDGRFEVDMARRLHGMGVPRFAIQAHVPTPEAAREAAACAAHAGVAGAVRFEADGVAAAGDDAGPFDVVWARDTLAAQDDPAATLARLGEVLAPRGVLLVASDLGGADDPAAQAVAERVWPILPERYRFDHVTGRLATDLADATPPGKDAARVLPALLDAFHFEAFFAWGNVAARCVGERFGPNLDPANERDRRFVDQLARLDDDKIEAGVLKPVRMVAALRAEPVGEPLLYRGWSPEGCLARPVRETRESTRPPGRGAGATPGGLTSGPAAPPRSWT